MYKWLTPLMEILMVLGRVQWLTGISGLLVVQQGVELGHLAGVGQGLSASVDICCHRERLLQTQALAQSHPCQGVVGSDLTNIGSRHH
jgi:hypothetical protein